VQNREASVTQRLQLDPQQYRQDNQHFECDATAYQVQVVKFCLVWVGLRGVNRDVYTIDRLLLLFDHIFYYVGIPAETGLL